MEISKRFLGPDVQATFFRESRRQLIDHQGAGHKEKQRRQYPQTDRGSSVVPRGRNPARPQHRGDVEEQHIPEAHCFAKLRFWISSGGRRRAHRVTSSAGMSWSCNRKSCKNGFLVSSNAFHDSNTSPRPSCRNTTISAK